MAERRHTTRHWWAISLLLAACGDEVVTHSLEWRARFSPEDLGDRVVRAHASIGLGACTDPPETLYATELDRMSDALPTPPPLAEGTYAFRVTARDERCEGIAEGCRTVILPGAEEVTVVLTMQRSEADCERCRAGYCDGDGGMDAATDAEMPDATEDADEDAMDGGEDAPEDTGEGDASDASDAMDGGMDAGYTPPEEPDCFPFIGPIQGCPETGFKRVFVTSTVTASAAFSGIAGADAECQRLADNRGFGGTFRAWLSDHTRNAIDRFSGDATYCTLNGGYVGTLHGTSLGLAGSPARFIDIDEFGGAHTGDIVWTGTQRGGARTLLDCDSWRDGTATAPLATSGTTGGLDATTCEWTSYSRSTCTASGRFFCIEL